MSRETVTQLPPRRNADPPTGYRLRYRAFGPFLIQALVPPDGPLHLQRISGGQSNPTYFVDFGSR